MATLFKPIEWADDQPAARTPAPAGPVETDPASVARAYEQINYLLMAGYDVQFKGAAGNRAIYCILFTRGLNRSMVAVQSGPNLAMALASAMDKAGFLSMFNQTAARG